MISTSPLIVGPDWQSFAQPQTQQQLNSEDTTMSRSGLWSPPPPQNGQQRLWGPNSLGGEALSVNSGLQGRSGTATDPIGSRPGSRLGEQISDTSHGNSSAKHPQQQPYRSFSPAKGEHISRASAAAAVTAAASSAAARSRATSPASAAAQDQHAHGPGSGVSSFGSPAAHAHLGRLDRASSPSFVTAHSHGPSGATMEPMSSAVPPGLLDVRRAAGTPKLVVDDAESSPTDQHGSAGGERRPDAWSLGTDRMERLSPSADSMTASFSALMARTNEEFPFGNSGDVAKATPPKLLRSNTDSSFFSSQNGPGNGGGSGGFNGPNGGNGQAPYQAGLAGSAAASTSSLSRLDSGLLSPSAAAVPNIPSFSTNASVGSTSHSASQLSLPLQSVASPPAVPFGQSMGGPFSGMSSHPSLDGTSQASVSELDGQLRASPLILDICDRLLRFETSVQELNRGVSGLNRNVSILLERTKHLPPHHAGGTQHQQRSMTTPTAAQHPFGAQAGNGLGPLPSEEVRALSAQVGLLSTTVSQLLAQNTGSSPAHAPAQQNVPLAGLGLGSATPQFASIGNGATPQLGMATPNVTTPQLGTFPGTPAFGSNTGNNASRFSTMGFPDAGLRATNSANLHADRNSRLSPRPGALSPNPNNTRRWRDIPQGTPDVTAPAGAMQPPDSNVIVTKWEHLNLHLDLLRSILRYGLGPPNKIQQRALPFLLRGSDIIAQAPPTQERIASYVIPVLQLVLNITRGEAALPPHMGVRGPMALIISTTVDQATQAQRMAMGLGAALGIRVHIAAAPGLDVAQDASALIQTQPQIVVGTPQKMMDLFNFLANKTKGAVSLDDIRIVVLDEVDQLIARNLADHVSTLLRILPSPRVVHHASGPQHQPPRNGALSPGPLSPSNNGPPSAGSSALSGVKVTNTDRQTAIFSNTVPQDVLNFAQSIHLRESVRVLVRREGGGGSVQPSVSVLGSTSNAPQSGFSGTGGAGSGDASSAHAPSAPPINALGASPANNHANPLADPVLASLRGLRQYYLYVAVTTGGAQTHAQNQSQIAHAVEMKLDVITDLLEDIDFGQAVIYTASLASHEAVTYKLASKGIEALGIHRDMASTTRHQVMAKYRSGTAGGSSNSFHLAGRTVVGGQDGASTGAAAAVAASPNTSRKKALVVHDLVVHPKDVHQVPLIVFYDLPRSVDEYKDKIACAASGGAQSRPSVCVNVVTGSGGPRGDIEMLRTLECHLGCKMAELPMNPGQILQF